MKNFTSTLIKSIQYSVFRLSIKNDQLKTVLFLLLITCCLLPAGLNAQVKIGDNTNTFDGSAVLEIEKTDQGFLPPRMTLAQANAINMPANGLMVFCTDCDTLRGCPLYNVGTPLIPDWKCLGDVANAPAAATVFTNSSKGSCYVGTDASIKYIPLKLSSALPEGIFILNGQYFDPFQKSDHAPTADALGISCLDPTENWNIIDADWNYYATYLLLDDGRIIVIDSPTSTANDIAYPFCNTTIGTYAPVRSSQLNWDNVTPVTIDLGGSGATPLRVYSSYHGVVFYGDDGNYYGLGANDGSLGINDLTFTNVGTPHYNRETMCSGKQAFLIPDADVWAWDNHKPHPDSLMLSEHFATWVKDGVFYFRGRVFSLEQTQWRLTNEVQSLTMPTGVKVKQFIVKQMASNGLIKAEMLFALGDDGNMYAHWLDGVAHPAPTLVPVGQVPPILVNGTTNGTIQHSFANNYFPGGIDEILTLDGKFTGFTSLFNESDNRLGFVFRMTNGDVAFLNTVQPAYVAAWTNVNTFIPASQIVLDQTTEFPMVVYKAAFWDANFAKVINATTVAGGSVGYVFLTTQGELWATTNSTASPIINNTSPADITANAAFNRSVEALNTPVSIFPLPCWPCRSAEIYSFPQN